jgi:xylulokinase
MAHELVIGIDASTTACKAVVWDASGRAVAEGRSSLELMNPEPDGYEQDAEAWWTATAAAVRAAVEQLGADRRRIVSLAVANQRETFVATDGTGKPLHHALVWMDSRCRREVSDAVAALGGSRIHEITGKPACTTPSLYKLLYLLRRKAPELAAARPKVLDVHAFIAHRLTGNFATSLAAADPMGLMDMQARDWSDDILDYAGLGRDQLPTLTEPGTRLGDVGAEAAALCGLPSGLPVIAGAGDGQAAGLGAGLVDDRSMYLNLGTAVVSGLLSGTYLVDPAFRTLYGALPGTFFVESDLKGGMFTVSWLLEKWAAGEDAAEMLGELEEQAARLPAGAEGLVAVPYWNGVMNPYWDDDATGITVGWRGAHGPAHLYRAILEGIALEERLHLSGVEAALKKPVERLVVMGGGAKSHLFCRILADVLERPIVRAASAEATALGAGMLAAAGAGLHPSLTAAATAMSSFGESFVAGSDSSFYSALYEDVYRALYPALSAAMRRLTELRS